jgi:hypothetical protein
MDHPAATVPDLPAGLGRPCHGGALKASSRGPCQGLSPPRGPRPPRLHLLQLHRRVHLLRPHQSRLFWVPFPRAEQGVGVVVVAAAVAEGDVVEVLAVGAPLLHSRHRVLLALLSQPLVRAHLHVALLGSQWRACPATMLVGAPPGFYPTPWTTPSGASGWDQAALARSFSTMGLTPVGPEWIADSGATYHTTLDPGILSSPSFLSPFVHHGRQWLVSSCHVRGCHWHSWLLSSS